MAKIDGNDEPGGEVRDYSSGGDRRERTAKAENTAIK
jgi:hypothetical protein